MREGDLRYLLQTLGSAAFGVALGLAVLGLGFVVSRLTLPERTVANAATVSPMATAVASVAAVTTPSPTVAASATRTATPTPAPTRDPLLVAPYQGQGLHLAAVTIPSGYTFTSPIAGRVSIALYQYADGEIKQGLTDRTTWPYILVRSADREIKIRPGAIDRDIKMLVKDGDSVTAGAPLFTTVTDAASSWKTFYDASVSAQVVVSGVALPSGVEIDAVALFKR